MKVTHFGPGGLPVAVGGWSSGIVSLNSNVEIIGGGPAALNFVQRITSNTSNTLLNPTVNFASGSNIAFAVQSNTLTIIGTAAGGGGAAPVISAGSNSTRVSEVSGAGASTTLWSPFDHAHDGIGTITASSSNTMQRGTWNIRPGAGIALSLTDTDGDGEFDTATIVNTGVPGPAGGGGGSPVAAGTLVQSVAWATVANGGTKTFGSTPTNGNTIYAFIVTNAELTTSLVQTNVTWTRVGRSAHRAGNVGVTDIWKGVVAASASTTVTFNFTANNVQAVILQEWSGLSTVDAAQSAIYYDTATSNTFENYMFAWGSLGGRAFLLVQNSTGGGLTTPPGWTASTGTSFNYGGSGNGSLYSLDASSGSGLYGAQARIVPVAADQHVAIFLHVTP